MLMTKGWELWCIARMASAQGGLSPCGEDTQSYLVLPVVL